MEGPSNQSPKHDGACRPPSPQSPGNARRLSAYREMSLSPPNTNPGDISPMRVMNHSEPQQLTKHQHPMGVETMMPTSRAEPSFPVKLHQLLNCSDDRIIRWQSKNDGKSFTILNCDAFETEVLPRLYRTANIEMFGQLLSLYGFQRVESGPYEGDYYHSMFIKDKPQLAHMIRKGADPAPVNNPTANPTTYAALPHNVAESMALCHSFQSNMHATVKSRLMGLSFPCKLHYLLCHGIYDLALESIMRWQPGGHAFAIHSSEEFEMQGLAEMLGTPGHASFRAQLFLHGFQRVRSDNPDVEAYYHADFVREQPQLCRLIRSRNHLKSNIIRRSPTTPTPRQRSIVSPLSNISVKSTISTASDTHFMDSSPNMMRSPEMQTRNSVTNNPNLPPPPLVAGASKASVEVVPDEQDRKSAVKPRKRPRVGHMMPQNYFPFKLHSLLTLAEKYGFQNIMVWAPHGRCFLVNDKDLFCATVLPLFRHSEFASFRAQLKAYGFVRIGKSGPDKGAYYHTSFLRGKPELCATITRRPKNVNGTTRGRPKGRSYVEPDFYKMKFLPELDIEPAVAPAGNIKEILEAALTQITPPAVVTREVATPSGIADENIQKPTGGQAFNTTRDTQDVVAKLVKQNDTQDTALPVKLHALLNDAHDHSFNRIVAWNDCGRSFSIADEQVFNTLLCEKWLNIPSLAHFQAELKMYGFKRRQNAPFKGAYYHEMFHKALPHLCRCMKKGEVEIPRAHSFVESKPVIDIDQSRRSSIPAAIAPVDSSLSTISNGSAQKRTNSPELEVAMALTAMDDRSAEGEQSGVEVVDGVSPLSNDERPIPFDAPKGKGLYVPDLGFTKAVAPQGQLVPEAENKMEEGDDRPTEVKKPVVSSPAYQIRASQQSSVNKRRSLDPPASCDMLAPKEAGEEAEKAEATVPTELGGEVKMGDARADVVMTEEIDLTETTSEPDDNAMEEARPAPPPQPAPTATEETQKPAFLTGEDHKPSMPTPSGQLFTKQVSMDSIGCFASSESEGKGGEEQPPKEESSPSEEELLDQIPI